MRRLLSFSLIFLLLCLPQNVYASDFHKVYDLHKTNLAISYTDCLHCDNDVLYFRGIKRTYSCHKPQSYVICRYDLKTGILTQIPLPHIKISCKFHLNYSNDSIYLLGLEKLVRINKKTLKVDKVKILSHNGSCSLSLIEDCKTGKKYIPVYNTVRLDSSTEPRSVIPRIALYNENLDLVYKGENEFTPYIYNGIIYSAQVRKGNIIRPFEVNLASQAKKEMETAGEIKLDADYFIEPNFAFIPVGNMYIFNNGKSIYCLEKDGHLRKLYEEEYTPYLKMMDNILFIKNIDKLTLYDISNLEKIREISIENYEHYLFRTLSYNKYYLLFFQSYDPYSKIDDRKEGSLIVLTDKKGEICRKIHRNRLSDYCIENGNLYILNDNPVIIEKINLDQLISQKKKQN